MNNNDEAIQNSKIGKTIIKLRSKIGKTIIKLRKGAILYPFFIKDRKIVKKIGRMIVYF